MKILDTVAEEVMILNIIIILLSV